MYTDLDDLVSELQNARIYAGLHCRFSTEAGAKLGLNAGTYVRRLRVALARVSNLFPNHTPSHAARKGTLAAGKLADLVLIDRNLFDIPPEQIRAAQVLATVVGGKVVSGGCAARFDDSPPHPSFENSRRPMSPFSRDFRLTQCGLNNLRGES